MRKEGAVLQETTTWDLRTVCYTPSTSTKVYLLFILLTFVVAIAKLLRIWWAAPPFRPRPKGDLSKHVQMLRASTSSLGRWIGLTFLAWGILASRNLVDAYYGLAAEKIRWTGSTLFAISESASALNAALFAVLFLYLSRWYIVRRMERLGLAAR